MANFCVNINTREFSELYTDFSSFSVEPLTQIEFAGVVSAIMENKGDLENLPSLDEVNNYLKEETTPWDIAETKKTPTKKAEFDIDSIPDAPQEGESVWSPTTTKAEPDYIVDRERLRKSKSKKLAGSTKDGDIYIDPVDNVKELYDYITGKDESIYSKQKRAVLDELTKRGYGMSRIKDILNTPQKANDFLILHEREHVLHRDFDTYWAKGKDLMTPDKISIEVRATINALNHIVSEDYVPIYREIEPAKTPNVVTGEAKNLPKDRSIPSKTRRPVSLKYRNNIPGKDAQYTQSALKYMNAKFFSMLEGTYSHRMYELFDASDSSNVGFYNLLLSEIYNSFIEHLKLIQGKYAEAIKNKDTAGAHKYANVASNIMHLLDSQTNPETGKIEIVKIRKGELPKNENFGRLVNIHADYLKQFGLEAVINLRSEEINTESSEKNTAELWHTEGLKFNFKETAASSTRLLFQDIKDKFEERGIKKYNEDFGTLDFVDSGKLFAVVGNLLANSPDTQTIIKRLQEKRNTIKGVDQIIDKIMTLTTDPSKMSKSDFIRFQEFMQTFSKHKNEYYFIEMNEVGRMEFKDAVVNSISKKIVTRWHSNAMGLARTSPFYVRDSSVGKFLYNTEKFKSEFYKDGNVNLDTYFANNRDKIPEERKQQLVSVHASRRKPLQRYYDHLNLLSDVFGIEIDNSNLPSEDFYNGVSSIIRLIAGKGENRNILGVETDTSGYLKPIIEHALEGRENDSDNSFQNGNNETQYGLQYNSYLTLTEDVINNVETRDELVDKLPHLASTFSRDSLLLNRLLFDKDGNRKEKISMKFIDILKAGENRESYNKLSISDKVLFMFNGSSTGVQPFFRAGDNSIETAYDGFDFVNRYGIPYLRDKAREYLVTEIETFREFKDDSLPEVKMSSGLNASRSQFSDVLTGKLEKQFNELIESNESIPQGFLNDFDTAYESYNQRLIQESIEFLEKYKLIRKDGKVWVNNGLVGRTSNNDAVQFTQKDLENVLNKAHTNKAIWSFEQSKLFIGHPGLFKDADDFFKRMSQPRGPKNKSLVDVPMLKAYEVHYPRAMSSRKYFVEGEVVEGIPEGDNFEMVYSIATYNDVMLAEKTLSEIKELGLSDVQIKPYSSMTESDAIGIANLDFYRDLMLTSTMWSEQYEMLYQWVTKKHDGPMNFTRASGQQITITDRNQIRNNDGSLTVFPMIKPQEFGVNLDPRFVTDLYKLAILPIIPSAIGNRPNMQAAQDMMTKDNVDMITFPSANKKGEYLRDGKKTELYNDDGTFSNDYILQHSRAKYWGIQLDTRGSKNKISGTQIRKIIAQNVYDKGKATNKKLADAVERYLMYTEEAILSEVKRLKKEIGIEDLANANKEQLSKVVKIFLDESKNRSAPNNVIESISMLPDYIDKGFGLDSLANRDKIEQILTAIANNRVIKNAVRGFMAVQAPQTLWESGTRSYKDPSIKERSEELEFDPKTGIMEVYVNHKFSEVLGKDISDIKIDPELLKSVGFRIPTSGMNSIERIKIKGFLDDTYGDIVILPSAIVAKAGSDFDVDKLNMLLYNYKANYTNFEINKARQFVYDYYKKETRKQSVISIYRDFLQDDSAAEVTEQTWNDRTTKEKEEDLKLAYEEAFEGGLVFQKLMNEDTPLGIAYKEKFGIGKIESLEKTPAGLGSRKAVENGMLDAMYDILVHTDRKNHIAPIGIDLFKKVENKIIPKLKDAVGKGTFGQLTHSIPYNILVQERNMRSKDLVGVEALQTTDQTFSQMYDMRMSDKPIPGTEMAYNELNFEEGTYNENGSLGSVYDAETTNMITEVLNQAVNAAVDGAKDPVFFNLNINFETAPVINYLIRRGVPFEKVMTFINQPGIRRFVMLKTIRASLTNKQNEFFSAEDLTETIKQEFGDEISQETVSWSEMESMLGEEKPSAQQRKLIEDFQKYALQAEAFGEYIQASRLDTQTPTNTSELDLKIALVERILRSGVIENVDKVFAPGTYLGVYYEALKAIQSTYKPFFLHSRYENSEFGLGYKKMLEHIVQSEKFKYVSMQEKSKILDKYKTDYVSALILNNPVTIYDGTPYGIIGDMTLELMTGNNSVAKRVMREQAKSDNPFLHALVPALGEQLHTIQGQQVAIDNLKMFDQRIPVSEQNALTDAYRDLFLENPQLAKDITALTMLQSGLKLSPITFTKYIPAEIYVDMFASTFELQDTPKITELSAGEFTRMFFINNFKDNNLVPMARKNRRGEYIPPSSDSFIYKYYPVTPEYRKASRAERENWDSSKRRKYQATPNIVVIAKNDPIGIFRNDHRFTDRVVQIDVQTVTDFGTSTSLLAYRDPIMTKKHNVTSEVQFQKKADELSQREKIYQIRDC